MLSTWLVSKDVSGCAQPPVQPSESQVTEVKKTETEETKAFLYFPLSTQDFYLFFNRSLKIKTEKNIILKSD